MHSLEPVFGAAASAAAAALVGAAARDGAIVLHRRDDGAVEAVPGAGDGARARGALDGLLSSRTRARRGDEEAAAAGAEPAPGRRLALERELQSLDRAIEAQPLALRLAARAGVAAEIAATPRGAPRGVAASVKAASRDAAGSGRRACGTRCLPGSRRVSLIELLR